MGLRMFLLLVLVLLVFTDLSQGVPETKEKSLVVSTFTDASAVGELLTTAHPISIPRRHNRLCNCKAKGKEMANTRCVCQQSGRRKGKLGKSLEKMCQRKKNKDLKKCRRFIKVENPRKFGPSIPI